MIQRRVDERDGTNESNPLIRLAADQAGLAKLVAWIAGESHRFSMAKVVALGSKIRVNSVCGTMLSGRRIGANPEPPGFDLRPTCNSDS